MADDDWFASMDEETPAADATATEAAPAPSAEGGEKVAAEGEGAEGGPPEGETAAEEAAAEDEYLDPDKLLLFKHWIRPKFLQYRYLYDYRHNYYNDVIDYLDKKCRGVHVEIPRPQTWAERALRTYTSKIDKLEIYRKELEEKMRQSLEKTKQTRRSTFVSYHSKEYMSRRYTSAL